MSEHIICAGAFEPKAFWRDEATPTAFVQLNLDVTAGDEAAAKARFRLFLDSLPEVHFLAFEVAREDDGVIRLGDPLPLQALGARPEGRADPVMAWLSVPTPTPAPWVTSVEPETGTFKDEGQMSASHLLATAETWDAPLGHDAGLTRILDVAGLADDKAWAVLPFFADAEPQDSYDASADGENLVFDYDPGGSFGSVRARVRRLERPDDDPTLLVDPDTGFLLVDPQAEDTHRLLARVREGAGSVFASAPQLAGLDWDGDSAAPPPRRQVGRLVWRALNGLLALLDSVLLALTMPGKESEGPFLAELLRIAETDAFGLETEDVARAIGGNLLQGMRIDDETAATKREAYAALLTRLFGLQSTDASSQEGSPLLLQLLGLYASHGPAQLPETVPGSGDTAADLERRLDGELAALLQRQESESGVETMALALLAETGKVGEALARANPTLPPPDEAALLAELRRVFDGPFNGLDASRFAVGALVETTLTSALPKPWRHQHVLDALKTSNWFAARFDLGLQTDALNGLADRLPRAAQAYLDQADKDRLETLLTEAFAAVRASLLKEDEGKAARFVPESLPRSVPVQFAVDADVVDDDGFARNYDGIALLVKCESDGGNWTYANLEKLEYQGDEVQDLAIRPLQPAAVDGQRRLFLEYDGLPLAWQGVRKVESEAARKPYLTFDAPTAAQLRDDGKEALPALVYGRRYAIAAHAISRGGSLPNLVRADLPWAPADRPSVPPDEAPASKQFARRFDYARTTAIGRMVIEEKVSGGMPRLNAALPGVTPLFLDYPRVGLGAVAGGSARLDLWRNADGSGAIPLPEAGKTNEVFLADARCWGGAGTLKLWAVGKPDEVVDPQSDPHWTIAITGPIEQGSLKLLIEGQGPRAFKLSHFGDGWSVPGNGRIEAPTGSALDTAETLWLHAELVAGPSPLALSFADPRAGDRVADGRPSVDAGPHLLVTPDDKAVWRPETSQDVTAKIPFPRVGYDDFERWMGNEGLRNEAADGIGGGADLIKKFRCELLARRALDVDESKGESQLELNALPDPAVAQLLVELTLLDQLGAPLAGTPTITKRIKVRRLGAYLQGAGGDPFGFIDKRHCAALMVQPANETFGLELENAPYPSWIKASIPAGAVARLSIRPLVAKSYFSQSPPVFDAGIREWSVGETADGYHLFAGAGLVIEKARQFDRAGDWPRLAEEMIEVRPAETQRRYDLAVRSTGGTETYRAWRELGAAEVRTQAWRFLGRPIYNWFAPKGADRIRAEKDRGGSPVVWVNPGAGTDSAFKAFEQDAFFERDPRDADAHLQKLEPLRPIHRPSDGASTVLQTFAWEKPSATLFRHKLRVRSRYAGAMLNPAHGETEVTRSDDLLGEWIRVAMLADRTRLQMTRPQLRALLPLTSAPDDGATPPVLALLEEPPLGHAGLAERIASEIRTGFGYALDPAPNPADATLDIHDARKEFGPDPRLTYQATDEEIARRLVLPAEGPIGLTFDASSAPAPAYVNCAYLLAPGLIGEQGVATSFEEHFLSVALRRYLDPDWVVDDAVEDVKELAPVQAWWIEVDGALTLEARTIEPGDVLVSKEILKIDGGPRAEWVVSAAASAVLPEAEVKPLEVARVPAGTASKLALLHQPLEDGRAALSVFALPERASRRSGRSNAPVLVAAFEWTSSGRPAPDNPQRGGRPIDRLLFSTPVTARPISASPPTTLNWARTGRNSDLLHAAESGTGATVAIPAASLHIARGGGGATAYAVRDTERKRWLRSALSVYPSPLHVHRHLALLTTQRAGGMGQALELASAAQTRLILGADLPIDPPGGDARLRLGRVIEFEVPARPLGAGGTISGEFTTALFDLKAILPEGKTPAGLAFWIRPLGGARTITSGAKLSFEMALPDQQKRLILSVPSDVPADGNIKMQAVLVMLPYTGATDPQVQALMVDPAGKRHNLPDPKLLEAAHGAVATGETISISDVQVNGRPPASEWWADVSMLTLGTMPAANAPVPFGFDWLFTGSGEAPAIAVSPDALRTTVEAQARIVSVSPPIPIMD